MGTNIRTEKKALKRSDLIYPEESYQIIGVLLEVYNKLGPGLNELTYQKAVAIALKNDGIKFTEQLFAPLMFQGEKVRNNYFDFLIGEKIVLELKKGQHTSLSHIEQLKQYLVSKNLRLGILAYFASDTLHFKRIVNL